MGVTRDVMRGDAREESGMADCPVGPVMTGGAQDGVAVSRLLSSKRTRP